MSYLYYIITGLVSLALGLLFGVILPPIIKELQRKGKDPVLVWDRRTGDIGTEWVDPPREGLITLPNEHGNPEDIPVDSEYKVTLVDQDRMGWVVDPKLGRPIHWDYDPEMEEFEPVTFTGREINELMETNLWTLLLKALRDTDDPWVMGMIVGVGFICVTSVVIAYKVW